MANFSPSKSTLTAQKLIEFLEKPVHELTLLGIPGVGPATVEKLKNDGIISVQQLMGRYLMFCTTTSSTKETCECFFSWLNQVSPGGHVHTITFTIANTLLMCRIFIKVMIWKRTGNVSFNYIFNLIV